MDTTSYALSKKKMTGLATDVCGFEIDGNKLIIHTNSYGDYTMTFPEPVDGKSLEFQWNDTKDKLGVRVAGDTDYVYSEKLSANINDFIHIGNDQPANDEILWIDTSDEYTAPKVTLTLSPTAELYDAVNDTLSYIIPSVTVVKGTNDIQYINFYIDGLEYKSVTTGVTDGGSFSERYDFATPTNSTFAVKVVVNDGKNNTVTKNIVFIGQSFYGTVDDVVDPTNVTEADILGLNSTLKNSRNMIYDGIAVDYGRVVYAYPKSLGALTKIVDQDGRDYTGSYTRVEIVVNDIDYYAYLLTDSMGTDNAYQKFS